MNRIKMLSLLLFIVILLLSAILLLQQFRFYKKSVSFRLDPLEESNLDSVFELRKKEFWIIGDSRAVAWDTSFLQFVVMTKVNLGIGGQTSKQILERFKNDLEINKPEYILMQFGINDLKSIGFLKDEHITQNCINNTLAILELCKKHNIKAIYTSIFPVGDIELFRRPLWKNTIYDSIKKVNLTIKTYCKKNNCSFFDAYSLLLEEPSSLNSRKEFQLDFFHLNEKGYVFLSNQLQKYNQLPVNISQTDK